MQTILFITRSCNFGCDYCYTGQKRDRHMPADVLEKAVTWTLDHSTSGAGIGFCGGEPLLRFELIEHAARFALGHAAGGQEVDFSISTNGTLIDDRVIDFLEKHRFAVQLSMDGNRSMHDTHRIYMGGGKSFDDVEQSLKRLLRRGIGVDVVMVMTPRNIAHLPESYLYLTQGLGAPRLSLNINYRAAWSSRDRSLLKEVLAHLAGQVMDSYRNGLVVGVNIFDEKIHAHIRESYAPEDHCPFGEGKIAVDVDGDIYPCDRIAGDGLSKSYVIGHVDRGIEWRRVSGMTRKLRKPESKCADCRALPRCRHWCGCINSETAGCLEATSDFLCFAEKLKIECADGIAETLFNEGNPGFLKKFYGDL